MDYHHHGAQAPGLAAPECARVDPVGLATLGAAAAGPVGLSPPTKEDAPRLAGDEGIRRREQDDNQDSDATDAQRKALATLTAKMAIAGFSLHPLADGSFLACRWGLSRPLPDLYAAHRFLRHIGGAA